MYADFQPGASRCFWLKRLKRVFDMTDKRKRTLVETCPYCWKSSDSLLQCSKCSDKTCKRDSFWCSAPGCKTRVCRFCQGHGPLAVVHVSGSIWLCSEHIALRCGICGQDTHLYSCWRCSSRCCRKHTFWCQIPDCRHELCGNCQENKEWSVTQNRNGWFCKEHGYRWVDA